MVYTPTRHKGKRLPFALTPKRPRWATLLLATVTVLTYTGLIVAYFWTGGTDPNHFLPHRLGIFLVILGVPALFMVAYWVRELSLSAVIRDTLVEIDREPAVLGEPLKVFVLQTRDYSRIRSLEASVVCRRCKGRIEENLASIPLRCVSPEDPGGRRAQFEETVRLPPDAAATVQDPGFSIEWSIAVRVTFDHRRVLVAEHPFTVVAAPGKEKPPAA